MEENNTESKIVDSTVDTTENTATEQEVATETKEKTEKTFTQEELDKILNKRFAKLKSDFEAEKTEAEKLAKMSAEEKVKHEFEKEKLKFEEERQAYLKEKLELQITKELASKNLPVEFSRYLIGKDAEESNKNIKEFDDMFQKAIQKAVRDGFKKTTPTAGSTNVETNSSFMDVIKKNRIL